MSDTEQRANPTAEDNQLLWELWQAYEKRDTPEFSKAFQEVSLRLLRMRLAESSPQPIAGPESVERIAEYRIEPWSGCHKVSDGQWQQYGLLYDIDTDGLRIAVAPYLDTPNGEHADSAHVHLRFKKPGD